jgi:hypothetical protein
MANRFGKEGEEARRFPDQTLSRLAPSLTITSVPYEPRQKAEPHVQITSYSFS